ncbi:dihydrofolate reductase family protein [Sinomicrobium sp. M5D2P9]
MKTILYAGLTANGNYGSSDSGQMPKQEELDDLFSHAMEAGNIVLGRRSYEIFGEEVNQNGLDVVVVSTSKMFEGIKTVGSPQEMLDYLNKKGYQQAFVVGGVSLHNSLLTDNLVDEMYININPYIAEGLDLRPTDGKYQDLELLGHKHIGGNIIQIQYKMNS